MKLSPNIKNSITTAVEISCRTLLNREDNHHLQCVIYLLRASHIFHRCLCYPTYRSVFARIKVIILNIFLGNLAFLKIVFMSHLVCVLVTHSSSLLYNTPFYLNMGFINSVNGCWSYFQFYVLTSCATMKTFVFISFAKTETLSWSADHLWHKWVTSVSRNASLLPSDWPGQGLGWPEPLTGSSYP